MAACSKKATEPAASTAVTTEATAGATAAPEASTAGAKAPDEVTLEFYMPSPVANVNDMDAVLEQFYKETKDTLNTKIHFNFTTFDDIGQKVSLKLAAGEQVDGVFTAPWTNPSIMQMIAKKQIANLDFIHQ
jgi:putative aldouronate transport system substrate-binding protein